jgi:multiple sugar transport system permease protein
MATTAKGQQLPATAIAMSSKTIRGRWFVVRFLLGRVTSYVVLTAVTMVLLAPAGWMISTSLKEVKQLYSQPEAWIPTPVARQNYRIAWFEKANFSLYLRNTLYLALINVVGQVASSALVAFAFARLRWPGRDILFLVCVSTMMLPQQVTMIPVFVLFTEIGWMNTFKPLIVPGFLGVPFFIFLLRQFFRGIPQDLDEAAIMDGASTLTILLRIIIPLSRPALAACAIFCFRYQWNDFLHPLLYLRDRRLHTLQLGLMNLQRAAGIEWQYLMAVSAMIMLPPLLLFFFSQRWFIQGINFSGLKG